MTDKKKDPTAVGCEIDSEQLSAYLDGELSAGETSEVERMLAQSEDCRAELEELRATVASIAALPNEAVPDDDLWIDVADRIGAPVEDNVVPLNAPWHKRMTAWHWLAAAAIALMIPGGAFVALTTSRTSHLEPALFDVREPDAPVAPEPEAAPEVPRAPRARGVGVSQSSGLSDRAVRAMIGLLDSDDVELRRTAVRNLGEASDSDEIIEALTRVIRNDTDGEVRRWAAWALGEIGDERAIEGLSYALLNDDYGESRRWAAWALGEIESVEGIEPLTRAFGSDPNVEVRRWAAWALGEIEDERAVAPLSRALSDGWTDATEGCDNCAEANGEVRRWAAWALGEIGSDQAAEALSDMVNSDPYPEARRWAAWALGEIGSGQYVSGLSRALLNDDVVEVRRWAAWALGEIQSAEAVPALSEALLNDESSEVRRWSAWALGEIEDERAIDALSQALESDTSSEVKRMAMNALTELMN